MSTEIALRPVNIDDSLKLQKVSEGLHRSGLYPSLKSPAGAYCVVQYGYELGLGPMTSLQNINLIQGKPAANGQTMLSLAMSRGVIFQVEEETHETCTILFKRGGMEYRSTFTVEDAKRAGLAGKDNWKKWPSEMLYWRAVAKGVRRIAPDAVMGLYTPDELSNGDVIDVVPVQAAPPKSEPKSDAATAAQLKALAAIMSDLGMTNRADKLRYVNDYLVAINAEPVTSSKELTKQQATRIIDDLKAMQEADSEDEPADVEVIDAHDQ